MFELNRAGIPFSREKNYEITYKGVILPHYYYADFVVWQKILFEAKAVEKLTDSHLKQVLNYLAASKLRVGLLVNFGGDVLEWKRVILYKGEFVSEASNLRVNSWNSCLITADERNVWRKFTKYKMGECAGRSGNDSSN